MIPDHHVACYRVADGKLLWDTVVPPGPWLRNDFRSGPGGGYAGPTPAHRWPARLLCLRFLGHRGPGFPGKDRLAERDRPVHLRRDGGQQPDPLSRHGDPVLRHGQRQRFAVCIAFDKASGEVKWRQKFPDMAFGHSTPVIISVKGQPQLLVLASGMGETGNALRSLDPASGKLLWWCRGAGDAASPAFGSGIVYFDSGRGGKGVAVDPGGTGRRLRHPSPLDRAAGLRGDRVAHHRRSPRVSPARSGRPEVLGGIHGQEGVRGAAGRVSRRRGPVLSRTVRAVSISPARERAT